MSDLVGNPEDRFSHNEAHIGTDNTAKMHRLNCAVVVRIMQIFDFITSSSTNLCSIKCNIDIQADQLLCFHYIDSIVPLLS